jgi:hypothetical protein
MTEDAFVDTRVKEFADHIQCDPELAQELYFKYDVDLTSDGADKMSLDAEIKALASLKLTKTGRIVSRTRLDLPTT